MKRDNKFTAFSSWMVELRRRRRRKKTAELEQLDTEGLEFVAESSGFRCTPYFFSNEFCEYVASFERNIQEQLGSIKLDEFNGDFKKRELQLISEYEAIALNSQLINHRFSNSQIVSQLLSKREEYENEITLIDNTLQVLKMEEDDNV